MRGKLFEANSYVCGFVIFKAFPEEGSTEYLDFSLLLIYSCISRKKRRYFFLEKKFEVLHKRIVCSVREKQLLFSFELAIIESSLGKSFKILLP